MKKARTTTSTSSSPPRSTPPTNGISTTTPPAQKRGTMILVADVIPNGGGQYIVTPRPPKGIQVGADGLTQWIPTEVARKILGLGRAMMWYVRQEELGKKHLRWRFISQSKRKILWDVESLFAYKAALQEIGK